MDPLEIIAEFYKPGTRIYDILVQHGQQVAAKAVSAAKKVPHLNPDLNFIREAAMLHDIGIFLTHTPEFNCTGKYPYVCHGYLGREVLESKGLPKHALVCERHVGVGITAEEIKRHNLPLPGRNMVPLSIEEQVICFADKFFSKNGNLIGTEKSVEDILCRLEPYGADKVIIFQSWVRLFK
ncbi:MAG: HDIG domain-containing protein [Desulfobacterales bacterium]